LIFPDDYKQVGITRQDSPEDPIYFATRYLISLGQRITISRISSSGEGFMRAGQVEEVISSGDQVVEYPHVVDTRNRALLIDLAFGLCGGGVRSVVFRGPDEHITFVHDPDPSAVLELEVLDVSPPDPPWLVYVIGRLVESGVLGDLTVRFRHNILDLRRYGGDGVYFPCRASGLGRSLDSDRVTEERPHIVGCEVSREIFLATSPFKDHTFTNICPVTGGLLKPTRPFVTRCCRSERRGTITINGQSGMVVHWGDGPQQVAEAVRQLATSLRMSSEAEGGGA